MDSSGFQQLVQNFTNLTPEENAEVARFARQYPYSQIFHMLRARAARDLAAGDKDELLHKSAVYATDRTVLKRLMTTPKAQRIVLQPEKPVEAKAVSPTIPAPTPSAVEAGKVKVHGAEPKKIEVTTPAQPTKAEPAKVEVIKPAPAKAEATKKESKSLLEPVTLSGDALREDLLRELEKLQHLKHEFEISVEEYERGAHYDQPVASAKSKTVAEPLIEEIKTTRKKIKVESPKLKEQNEIIDKFIKSQPVIPKAVKTEAAPDLSEESANLSDNVVSETLVNILVKQGKKDKAIEVLKKLIWKFPQKKAYFAAQIESLKN